MPRSIPRLLLRPLVAAALLALPGLGAAQDTSAPTVAVISAAFPYERQFVEVMGSRMAYVEEGEGPVVLFVHGNPTSSYLWRNVIPHVSDDHRAMPGT